MTHYHGNEVVCVFVSDAKLSCYTPNSRFRLEQKESRAKRVKTIYDFSPFQYDIGEDIELTRTLSYIE